MFDKLSLFNISKLKRDPFANKKSVLAWLSELPNIDIAATQEQITSTLTRLRSQPPHADHDRLEVLACIDDYSQPLLSQLCTQYLRNSRMSTAMEARLWHSIYTYYREITFAYYSGINPDTADPELKTPGALQPQITLRMLNNLGNLFKWRFIHYDRPDEDLWRLLHQVYRMSEASGFANQLLPLYPGGESKCVHQFVRALLLAQMHPSALPARQIEMADIWLLKWVHLLEIEPAPCLPRHHFVIDLAQSSGVEAVTDRPYPDTSRCWDASPLLAQLHRTREEIKTQKRAPSPEIDARAPEYLKMLAYVELQLTPGNLGKLRKAPRTATKKTLHVLHGFYVICTAIKNHNAPVQPAIEADANMLYAEMVDIQLYGFVTETTRNRQQQRSVPTKAAELPYESWEAENVSTKGYLARSPTANNDWLRLGCLVGVKDENDYWKVAVVRRLSRARLGNTRVGMEVLAQTPVLAALRTPRLPAIAAPDNHNTPSAAAGTSVMALITSPIQGGHLALIIDSVQYAKERPFQTTIDGKPVSIRLERVLEKGDSWICVGASVLS